MQDPEGYGELVYTTLSRRTMPLIRYRSRDVARIDANPCRLRAYRRTTPQQTPRPAR